MMWHGKKEKKNKIWAYKRLPSQKTAAASIKFIRDLLGIYYLLHTLSFTESMTEVQGFIVADDISFEFSPPVISDEKATEILRAEWGHTKSPYLNFRDDEPKLNILQTVRLFSEAKGKYDLACGGYYYQYSSIVVW